MDDVAGATLKDATATEVVDGAVVGDVDGAVVGDVDALGEGEGEDETWGAGVGVGLVDVVVVVVLVADGVVGRAIDEPLPPPLHAASEVAPMIAATLNKRAGKLRQVMGRKTSVFDRLNSGRLGMRFRSSSRSSRTPCSVYLMDRDGYARKSLHGACCGFECDRLVWWHHHD